MIMEQKLAEYKDFFSEDFPTFNFMHLPEDGIIQVIDSCLNAGKDVYALGYVKDDEDISY